MKTNEPIAIWGGMECTVNRVKNQYFDQSEYAGHYQRGTSDIDLIASLGLRTLRYPVLWEKHLPAPDSQPDWTFVAATLGRMREHGITPIAGLVHHGSGPAHVNFFDGSFEEGLAAYARQVAERFPWIEYYTPVNEPLTTARFCGLYGHWYPHGKAYPTFLRILIAECKATVLAMRAIQEINPNAKLVQTEDLGKCHSTPLLKYEADFENERRWLSYELLCGTLTPDKVMYRFMVGQGIEREVLDWFLENPCRPHIAGFNYYLTSERYLDEDMEKYPRCYHGNNHLHHYADIHTVHVPMAQKECGPYQLLKEAWERLQLPMAITECHLHSTREDQIRWFHSMWKTVNRLAGEGVDISAITAWALFGLYGWNELVTKPGGVYEPGVFRLSSGVPKPTALAGLIRELTGRQEYYHPVLERDGWWERSDRLIYGDPKVVSIRRNYSTKDCRPLLVLGKNGTLGGAVGRISKKRNIYALLLGREDIDLTNGASIEAAVEKLNPWGVINAAGYVNVDGAESEEELCTRVNAEGPATLAAACRKASVRFLTFSSDLVFDGQKGEPYVESDPVAPLNAYGRSKALSETNIALCNPEAVIIRTSSFFGPWDDHNFLFTTLRRLKEGKTVRAAGDVVVSPTYVPDLVHMALDLLLDGEGGIFHVTNDAALSWADFARYIALRAGYDERLVQAVPQNSLGQRARRPKFSALSSEKGLKLTPLADAIDQCLDAMDAGSRRAKIAV